MVKKNSVFLALVFLWLAVNTAVAASTSYVDSASLNDPGSGTFEDPFRRIQTAIDNSTSGDIVEIRPGVYSGDGNYNLDPNGKSIIIRSVKPGYKWFVSNTVIDPNGAGRSFYIHSGEDANCVISGLTIKNGYINGLGAGIYCQNSSPVISQCVISSNLAVWNGGGLFIRDSNIIVYRCIISDNSTTYSGGGAVIWGGKPTFKNCIIRNNRTINGSGAGISSAYGAEVQITNCTMTANSATKGGAVFASGGDVNILNTISWANIAPDGTELGIEEEAGQMGLISVNYTDIEGGPSAVYDPCSGLDWGQGNINSDPCFISFDPNSDPNLWDLHLQSEDGRWNPIFYKIDLNQNGIINLVEFAKIAGVWLEQGNLPEDLNNNGMVDWSDLVLLTQYYLASSFEDGWVPDANTSPCIDAGDPNSDWSAEPWPNVNRINMGAYGGTAQASKSGNIADLNIDGIVNFLDLAEMGRIWGENNEIIEDLNGNGTVETGDIYIMAENWLWEK